MCGMRDTSITRSPDIGVPMQMVASRDEQLVVGFTKNQRVGKSMNQDPTEIAVNVGVHLRRSCGSVSCHADSG